MRQLPGSPSEVGVVLRVEGGEKDAASALAESIRRVVQSQHSQNAERHLTALRYE